MSVDVTNTGSRDGNEIVQMYVNTPNADPSLQRPIKRLEGFQKVFLAAGQTKTVTLPIKIADLAFYNEADKRFEVDQGAVRDPDLDVERRRRHPGAGHDQRQRQADAEAERRSPRSRGSSSADTARGISQRVMFPENVDDRPGPDRGDERRLAVRVDRARPEQAAPARDEAQLQQRPAGRRLGRPRQDVIRTVSNGAATVTATATYHGASASTSFVVRVRL